MADEGKLSKSITWLQGTALTIGAVIGAGILALPAIAAQAAGPASLAAWLLMGLFALPMIVAIAQMSSRWPNSGGIAAYAGQAYGPLMERLTGAMILIALPIGMPPTALIGANYLCSVMGFGSAAAHLTAGLMIFTAIALNYRGIEISGRVQLVVVGLIVTVLLFVVITSFSEVRAANFTPFMPHGAGSVAGTMALLFFAFLGWEMISNLAEEFRDPRRDLPISLGAACLVVNAVYLSIAFVIVGSGAYLRGSPNVAIVTLIDARWGAGAAAFVGALGCLICYCPVHTYVAGFSRLVYSQAREGYFPAALGRLHERYHTPYRTLELFAPVALTMLAAAWYFKIDLRPLLQIPSTLFLAAYTIGMASAARVLPTKIGRGCGALSALLCGAVLLCSGWYILWPLGAAACFALRYGTRFKTSRG